VSDARPAKPLPSLTGGNGEFYRRLAETRELAFQSCGECGRLQHPPRLTCPHCGSAAFHYAPVAPRGRVYTWTVTHQALVPSFAAEVPYAAVVTELDCGVRIVTGIRGMTPDMLSLDLAVEVVLEEVADGVVLPYVRPARS
jgi:uncharacterized OB-fold protein